jgi:hypothetical protein
MDRIDQPSNAEKGNPQLQDPTLPEAQTEHLARRRFLKTAVATTAATVAVGSTAAVAVASGDSSMFVRGLLYTLSPNGGGALPSATNFVAIDMGRPDMAHAIGDALFEQGVFVRMPGTPPFNRASASPSVQQSSAHLSPYLPRYPECERSEQGRQRMYPQEAC